MLDTLKRVGSTSWPAIFGRPAGWTSSSPQATEPVLITQEFGQWASVVYGPPSWCVIINARSRFLLQRTGPHPSTLSSHTSFPSCVSLSHTSHMLVPHFSSQNLHEHARLRSFLQRTSLPFPPVLSCTVDFTLTFFYCDCNVFFFTFCFPAIFLEEFVYNRLLFCLFFEFVASAVTDGIFVII